MSLRSGSSRGSRGSAVSSLKLSAAQARADWAVAKARQEFVKRKAAAEKAKVEAVIEIELLGIREEVAISQVRVEALDKEVERLEIDDEQSEVHRLPVESKQEKISRFLNEEVQASHSKAQEDQTDGHKTQQQVSLVRTEQEAPEIALPSAQPAEHTSLNVQAAEFLPTLARQSSSSQDDMMTTLVKQQIEMAKAIVTSQQKATLPRRKITPYNGDATEYNAFIKAFEHEVEGKTSDGRERLYYLEQFTVGDVNKLVRSFLHLDADKGYQEARKAIAKKFGNKYKMADAYMQKAQRIPDIRAEDPYALNSLSLFLLECRNAMSDLNYMTELNHSTNIQMLVSKLPYKLRGKWRAITDGIQEDQQRMVTFDDLVDYVEKQSRIANNPVYGMVKEERDKGRRPHRGSFVTVTGERSCLHCKGQHELENCTKFDALGREVKIEFLKQARACFGCLRVGHRSKECRRRLQCKTCKGFHPTTLHRDAQAFTKPSHDNSTEVASACSDRGECTLAIVPVKVMARKGSHPIATYAFFDPGSSISFISEELLHKIGADGKRAKLSIETMGNTHTMTTNIIKGLVISSLDGKGYVELPVAYTKDRLPVSRKHIPTSMDIAKWPHLKEVNVESVDADVGLLIGNAVAEAYCPLQVITGPACGPHATRTKLGWLIWNMVREGNDTSQQYFPVNRIDVLSITRLEEDRRLEKLVRISTELDFPETGLDHKKQPSREDKLFLSKVEKSIKFEDGHYTIDLPFREDHTVLPNNKSAAWKRLTSLKNRLQRDENFHKDYTEFMKGLIEKGFAEEVASADLVTGNKWYLPHHGIYNPRKPGKIRVVFDCAARFEGVALNDMLLPGPNLTNNLVGVSLRFREEPVAIMADIDSMFHQVRVPVKDRDYLRFLWWRDGELEAAPVEYRMKVHLFGAASSPSCANMALRQTACDNEAHTRKEVALTVLKSFYVDDCLKSVGNETDGINLVKDLKALCTQGGFNLAKWTSNRRVVIESIPVEDRSKELQALKFKEKGIPNERALGVQWQPEGDYLFFELSIKEQPCTRRGILATISSVFDPMGLASPIMLTPKILLQELIKTGKSWDKPIEGKELKQWKRWLEDLPLVERLKVPRFIGFGVDGERQQLHVFADASERGYGVVVYIRAELDGKFDSNIIYARSRVAPLKKLTIPRLELTAATVAVKCTSLILDEMEINFKEVVYWTDSMLVLHYIRNSKTRFSTFVANRLTTIHKGSKPCQWRHVDTCSNPADLASRGMHMSKENEVIMWLKGPDFLREPNCKWPKAEEVGDHNPDDLEVKGHVCAQTACENNPIETLIHYFSSWYKLKRAVAWILKIKATLLEKVRKSNNSPLATRVTLSDMREAERALICFTQRKMFKDEIEAITANVPLKKSSSLVKLDPYIKDGQVRVGGRLRRSSLPDNMKHQILLPKGCHISELVLREVHCGTGHCGRNHVLAEFRKRFWMPQAPSAVRKIISRCVTCRRYSRALGEQKMADLPAQRVMSGERAFTRTGMDYFGPFLVKRGRTELKRYGVVFTCFATRAIHIELACSLSTDSCINAIRRFCARRGSVKAVFSDNGTNIVGAEKELRMLIKEWNKHKIEEELKLMGIEWHFNPPGASHHGGTWERMIRSIRKVLYGLLKEQNIRFDDEGMATLLCEAEAIVNSRPLTMLSDDPNEDPLTPNHFLLGQGELALAPGRFERMELTKRWRQIQYLTNIFWKRWVKEYLVTLQERQRWTRNRRNVVVGDIVLVADITPRGHWLMARVLEVYPDSNGQVRTVKVKTKSSTLVRPITKLVVLLEADE